MGRNPIVASWPNAPCGVNGDHGALHWLRWFVASEMVTFITWCYLTFIPSKLWWRYGRVHLIIETFRDLTRCALHYTGNEAHTWVWGNYSRSQIPINMKKNINKPILGWFPLLQQSLRSRCDVAMRLLWLVQNHFALSTNAAQRRRLTSPQSTTWDPQQCCSWFSWWR